MHQSIDKKYKFVILIIIFLFLTTYNNYNTKNNDKFSTKIKSVKVRGLTDKLNSKAYLKLSFLINENILFLDKSLIKNTINQLNYVEDYRVTKLYPSKIIIDLKQTEFIGTTIVDEKKYIIGSNGKLIDSSLFKVDKSLPKYFGKFSTERYIEFLKILKNSNFTINDIKNIFYYPSGRVDIKTKDDYLILLPINNADLALNKAMLIMKNLELKKKIIDLRVPNQIILLNE